MPSSILKELEEAERPVALDEMSRRVGVERSALDGMLQLLVRMGRLREVGAVAETCSHCPGRLSCARGQTGNALGKAYELVG
jgi:hypothetical protein